MAIQQTTWERKTVFYDPGLKDVTSGEFSTPVMCAAAVDTRGFITHVGNFHLNPDVEEEIRDGTTREVRTTDGFLYLSGINPPMLAREWNAIHPLPAGMLAAIESHMAGHAPPADKILAAGSGTTPDGAGVFGGKR